MRKIQTFPPNFLVRILTVFADFWANYPKICRNCQFKENLLTRKLGRKAYILHGENYKQLVNKIYSFNNIVTLC